MNKTDNLAKLIVAQTICVLIIVSSVVVIKYFFKGTYKQFTKWYTENVCVDTDINEVLEDEV